MRKKAPSLIEVLQNKEGKKESGNNIVLPDECGDSLWDKVLEEQDKKTALQNSDDKTLPQDNAKK